MTDLKTMDFSAFGLSAPILKTLAAEAYTTPTPIQTQAIPLVLEGHDVCGIAQTGTGKTAAFGLPLLHLLAQNRKTAPSRHCRALILAPTRELASQICDSLRTYSRGLNLSVHAMFGGVSLPRQQQILLKGVDVLVATPGRLLDLKERRALSLEGVELLVLDEADQMLDLGFIHALKKIVSLLPKKRQTLFFSATMPKSIAELAESFLRDPKHIAVTPVATTAEKIDQAVISVSTAHKQKLLHLLLEDAAFDRALVFTKTKHGANRVATHLVKAGIRADAIHGNKSQAQRERALAGFRKGQTRVLIATDIAARGIDIPDVSHVINFDLPNVPESYVHRIGRTARAGAEGKAIAFCSNEERGLLRDIERLTRQSVARMPTPEGIESAGDLEMTRPAGAPPSPRGRIRKKYRPDRQAVKGAVSSPQEMRPRKPSVGR